MNFWEIHGNGWIIMAVICLLAAKSDVHFLLVGGLMFYIAGLSLWLARERKEDQPQDREPNLRRLKETKKI